MTLTLIRIKPNPAGKDRPPHGGPAASQLAAEWVDFRNDTGQAVTLDGVSLWHLTYAPGRQPEWAHVTNVSGVLQPGKVVRVHAGIKRPLTVIRPEDLTGADHHVFTGEDAFVWNNREGDTALLYKEATRTMVDKATYAPHPPEGVVLVRRGDQFVPALAHAASW